ncbi:UNVERIFIED_CONTAM: hypothetical protein FKN15_028249 [Acipenser sinensis]
MSPPLSEWELEPDPTRAAWLFKRALLSHHETGKPLNLRVDIRENLEDQVRALMTFYKAPNIKWACPLKCTLEGDTAVGEGVNRYFFSKTISKLQFGFNLNLGNTEVTRLFEGEPDHLVPSTSQFLLESDIFLMAGRMIGHSFLHGGPCLSGISPAIIHVLFGGTPKTATIQLEDFPDLDLRSTIQLLEGNTELSEKEKGIILDLALSWDLPGVNQNNRRWLFERLLLHAVIGCTSHQIKQLRRGLKDTMVWPLLHARADVILLVLPRESDALYTSQMIIERITWPAMRVEEDEEEEEECSLETKCRITGYLRRFIDSASSTDLKDLMKFWV